MSSSIARVTARMPHHTTDLTVMQHNRHERTPGHQKRNQPLPEIWSLISLSIRHFRDGLLIEVHDTSSNPPIRSRAAQDAESGRGLMLVEALSREWSYFFPLGGGKVVSCFLEMR